MPKDEPSPDGLLLALSAGGCEVGLRRMSPGDQDVYVGYWHGIADLDFLGIDRRQLGTAEDSRRRFAAMVDGPRPRDALGFTITVDGQPAGFINVNVFGRPYGVPHFHLVDPTVRRRGILSHVLEVGLPVILRVVEDDADAHGLRVEVRARNVGMNRVLQRLGYQPTQTVKLMDPDGLAGPGTFHLYKIQSSNPGEAAMTSAGKTCLWRPTGPEELALVEQSGWRAWPPRLPEQPIFYPVLNEAYATKIAREWNVPASGVGYVTRFQVRNSFLERYDVHQVGGRNILEYWVPAEDLDDFNANIVGLIEVTAEYRKDV